MKRSVLSLLVVALLVASCSSSFPADTPQVKVGVVFTSDTFDIPDNLSDLVTGLFNNALSRYSNVSIVKQEQIKYASNSLGFNQTHLSTPQNLKAIGERAGVNFMVWTRINYDFKEAAKAEASRALGKLLKLPSKSLTKHLKPDFDVRVVDVSSAKLVFNNKFNLDIFSSKMKDQLLAGLLSGGDSLSMGSLDTSVIKALADKLAPAMQTIMNEAALLAAYKDTGNTEGIVNTVVDLAHGKTHDTKTVAQKSAETYLGNNNNNGYYDDQQYEIPQPVTTPTNNYNNQTTTPTTTPTTQSQQTSVQSTSSQANFENKSTDPAKVIGSYGLSKKATKNLIGKHADAVRTISKQERSDRYRSIFKQNKNDYLAAYGVALAEFEMNHGGESAKWCNRALAINPRYLPAKQLLKRAKGL